MERERDGKRERERERESRNSVTERKKKRKVNIPDSVTSLSKPLSILAITSFMFTLSNADQISSSDDDSFGSRLYL